MSRLLRIVAPVLLLAATAPVPTYLAPGSFDVLQILPPAPVKGDVRYEADRKIFRRTRALKDTPRWALAVNDIKLDAASMMADFSCAAGVTLTPTALPRLTAMLEEAARDASHQTSVAKAIYKRQRPFRIDAGPTCEPLGPDLDSYDYPSGHTTRGWTWALILAEAMPDHASALLARGRAFGQSRIVCGVHNESAVHAGYLSASSTMDAVRATPAYQADLAAARQELASAAPTASRPDPATCAAETVLVAQRLPD